MIKVAHIIYILTPGGAARAMMSAASELRHLGEYQHTIISLLEPNAEAVSIAHEAGMEVVHPRNRDEIDTIISNSDMVQIEWWNEPMLDDFLRTPLPKARVLCWFHICGNRNPQFISLAAVNFADIAIASSPRCAQCPAIQSLDPELRSQKVRLAYDCADFNRVKNTQQITHSGFRVGYIGTVNPIKMHSNFVNMSASLDIPDVKIVVCGGDQQHIYSHQARQLGAQDRFEFKGYVDDIGREIAQFDVYGYPLCEDTFASAELNLQEVMYVGIPPVVFPHGGIRDLIVNDFTGYLVHTDREYKEAIEYLYHRPAERERLSTNAKIYARQLFGAQNAARKFKQIYDEALQLPKTYHEWQPAILPNPLPQSHRSITRGASCFLESLGEIENIELFLSSLFSIRPEESLPSDHRIASLSPLMKLVGVRTYAGYYNEDPWLQYWSALCQFGDGNYEQAILQLSTAMNLRFPDWRPLWFACLCLHSMGEEQELRSSLGRLLEVAPDFQTAINLNDKISSQEA